MGAGGTETRFSGVTGWEAGEWVDGWVGRGDLSVVSVVANGVLSLCQD